MSVPTTDMYTTVERSIFHKLTAGVAAAGGVAYMIFNNQVDKKKFPDLHGAIAIMKVSDVFTAANGGGQSAAIQTPVLNANGQAQSYTFQPWPDSYDLMYQIEATADNLPDVRAIENIIRTALRPRQPLYLWDSTNAVFTEEWIDYHYAGYINRDIPEENIYNRILNVRFEARNWMPTTSVPAITQITVTEGDTVGDVFDTFTINH